MAKVIWKPIDGYEGLYEVSSDGRVRSLYRYKKELKPNIGRGGYYYIQLWNKGKGKCVSIHRLVAEAFCDNPKRKPFVNHIDENKLNNNIENLEWVTHKENCNHGTAIARRVKNTDFSKRRVNNKNQIKSCSKPITQYSKNGEFIRNWESASECSRATGISISGIRRVCTGERKSTKGFIFKEVTV